MPRIAIVTPARAGTRNGNRHTATRWARMLRDAGMKAEVLLSWRGEKCDALLALHARRSHESIRAFRAQHPDAPLVVTLTGTDLYKDLPRSAEARRSLTVPEDSSLSEREEVWYQLTEQTMRDLDQQLEQTIREAFFPYIVL